MSEGDGFLSKVDTNFPSTQNTASHQSNCHVAIHCCRYYTPLDLPVTIPVSYRTNSSFSVQGLQTAIHVASNEIGVTQNYH